MTQILLAMLGCLLIVLIITGLIRRYAIRNSIVDVPNSRSSHTVITPRGAGLAIVVVFYLGLIYVFIEGLISLEWFLAMLGGIAIAIVGWIDDRRGLMPGLRFSIHSIVALWALFWLGGLPSMRFGESSLYLGWIGTLLAAIGIVWMTNLYNFMDGIDGLAGSEAVIVAAATGIYFFISNTPGMMLVCFFIVGGGLGFLFWNWPPAKIFMGDVGSCFLGYIFAILMIISENSGALPLVSWLLLLGVFCIDATMTLLRRVINRQKWLEPHRTHVYQLAVQAGFTHKQVTATIIGINFFLVLTAGGSLIYPDIAKIDKIATVVLLTVLHYILRRGFENMILQNNCSTVQNDHEKMLKQAAAEQSLKN